MSMLVGAVMPRQNTALALEEVIRKVAAKDIAAVQRNRNTRIDFSSMMLIPIGSPFRYDTILAVLKFSSRSSRRR
jgi:hypothetical protein